MNLGWFSIEDKNVKELMKSMLGCKRLVIRGSNRNK